MRKSKCRTRVMSQLSAFSCQPMPIAAWAGRHAPVPHALDRSQAPTPPSEWRSRAIASHRAQETSRCECGRCDRTRSGAVIWKDDRSCRPGRTLQRPLRVPDCSTTAAHVANMRTATLVAVRPSMCLPLVCACATNGCHKGLRARYHSTKFNCATEPCQPRALRLYAACRSSTWLTACVCRQ